MRTIGIRELRQNASRYLRLVRGGEVVQITDRGEPVARLVPIEDEAPLARLEREGRIRPATRDLRDLPPPLPLEPDEVPPSEILERQREDRI